MEVCNKGETNKNTCTMDKFNAPYVIWADAEIHVGPMCI